MSHQAFLIVVFILGIITGSGCWYACTPGRYGFGLIPLLAALLFIALLVGWVHL